MKSFWFSFVSKATKLAKNVKINPQKNRFLCQWRRISCASLSAAAIRSFSGQQVSKTSLKYSFCAQHVEVLLFNILALLHIKRCLRNKRLLGIKRLLRIKMLQFHVILYSIDMAISLLRRPNFHLSFSQPAHSYPLLFVQSDKYQKIFK